MTAAHQYAGWVLKPGNERETGRLIKLAAQRFMSWLERDDIYFDEVEAVRMVDFCEEYLCQWEGDWEGMPFKFEPWQRFIFEQVYGWIRKDTGTRLIEEVYVQISKKNGKSTMCAGLMNFHVFADPRVKTPKVFTAANNEEQAKICVNMAGRIVEFSPALSEMVEEGLVGLMRYKENITEVINYENNGFIKAFSKESGDKKSKTAGGKHGVNASLGVVDEYGMSPDHGASKPIKTSMASRKERLMFKITTAGFNLEGPCYLEERGVGIKILEGSVVKDNTLVIIFEIDPPVGENGQPDKITPKWLLENEWAWKQSNPNLDVSVNREFLRGMVADAIDYGGRTETDVMTLNFNIWMHSPEVWIPADVWDRNVHGLAPVEGEDCYAGVEIGPSGEISAVAFLFPGEIVKIKMLFMIAEDSLKFNDFYKQNAHLMKVDAGDELEIDISADWIVAEFQRYNLHSFCFPATLKNNSIIQKILKMGYVGNPISQRSVNEIADPTDTWQKMLRAAQIDHGNDPILKWMNSNCTVVRKETGTRLEKSGKVLGIYACINALAQWKTVSANEGGTLDIIVI